MPPGRAWEPGLLTQPALGAGKCQVALARNVISGKALDATVSAI